MAEKDIILAEWIDFCAGKKDFDSSHFYTLFHEGRTINELDQIFKPFSSSKALINNMVRLFQPEAPTSTFTNYPLPGNKISSKELTKLVDANISQLRKLCKKLDEPDLAEELGDLKIIYTDFSTLEKMVESDLGTDIDDLIGDYFIESRIDFTPKTNAIFEAYNGLVSNESLVNFLGAPLIKAKYDFEYDFFIWKGGGKYIISDSGIMVTSVV